MKLLKFMATVLFSLVLFLLLETYFDFYDTVMVWAGTAITVITGLIGELKQ